MSLPHGKRAVEQTFTRRQFLTYQLMMEEGRRLDAAIEAVSSWAIANPMVKMEEEMTWGQWERMQDRH